MSAIPDFFVYGVPARQLDVGLMHVETVMARRGLHHGEVKAHKHAQMSQITFWTAGRGSYFIEDEVLDFSAPAISFVPSHVVHGFSVASGSDAIVLSLADDVLPTLAPLSLLPLDCPIMLVAAGAAAAWRRIALLMALIEERYAEGERDGEPVISALATAVLNEMRGLSAKPGNCAHEASTATRLRRLVETHFREEWPIERYACALNVTPYRLAQISKKSFGSPVKELVSARRLLEAKRLLLFTVRSVEAIADEIGLGDPAYFSRFFRNRAGEAPSRWRDRHVAQRHGRDPAAFTG